MHAELAPQVFFRLYGDEDFRRHDHSFEVGLGAGFLAVRSGQGTIVETDFLGEPEADPDQKPQPMDAIP